MELSNMHFNYDCNQYFEYHKLNGKAVAIDLCLDIAYLMTSCQPRTRPDPCI